MQEKLQGYRGQETSFPDAQFLPKAGVSQGGRKQINTVCDLLLTSDTSESLWSTLSISPQGPHPAGPGSCGRVLSEGPYYCRLPQVLPSALRFYSHHQQPWTHLPKPWDRKSLPFPWHWEERGTVNASWRRWGGGVAIIHRQLPLSSCKSCHCWAQSRPSEWEEEGEPFRP